jgi:hypothetical protein
MRAAVSALYAGIVGGFAGVVLLVLLLACMGSKRKSGSQSQNENDESPYHVKVPTQSSDEDVVTTSDDVDPMVSTQGKAEKTVFLTLEETWQRALRFYPGLLSEKKVSYYISRKLKIIPTMDELLRDTTSRR